MPSSSSLRVMEVVQRLVRRCTSVITGSHGVEMPEIHLISKREVQFRRVAGGHCPRQGIG